MTTMTTMTALTTATSLAVGLPVTVVAAVRSTWSP